MSYRVTVRRGPKVEREQCETLDDALAVVQREARGGREAVEAFGRRYESGSLVAARIEVRGPHGHAGVDVRGDGSLIPYRGRVRRKLLEGDDPYEALRQALRA